MSYRLTKRQQIVGRELIAGLGLCGLYPFGIGKPKEKRHYPAAHERTIVLVHGYMANRSCFLPLIGYLKLHGFRRIVSYQYPSRGSIEGAAIDLKQFVQSQIKGGKIALVGHSLGGVIIQIYLQILGGARRTSEVVTIGSPHEGTFNAYWVPTRIGDQLRPESPLMQKIEQTKDRVQNIPITRIVGGSDNIILPRRTSHQQEIVIANTGHLGLLWSPQVMALILKALRQSEGVPGAASAGK